MLIYTVRRGDTLNSIAKMYDVPPFVLSALNEPLPQLVEGQSLVIRRPDRLYTVKYGDTVALVSLELDVDIYAIMRNNPQIIGRELYVGESLVISYDDASQIGRAIVTNAYTYTYTDKALITKALPYLTMLTIFTYGFNPSGELVTPPYPDEPLIRLAYDYGVKPVMLLSTLTEDGSFSSELAGVLLQSEYLQEVLIERIINNMQNKGYYGLDVDFEYVAPQYKEQYADFVQRLTDKLNKEGLLTLVALAPKTSSAQTGLLYEAHDYFALGNAANLALTMTYEWGYTYSRI